MPRTNLDGKPIKRVLSWLLNRDLTDGDLAAALGMPRSNYERHKDDPNYPSFEELDQLGRHFGISPTCLQIAFGLLPPKALAVLDDEELRCYIEQGGGNHPYILHWGKVGDSANNRRQP